MTIIHKAGTFTLMALATSLVTGCGGSAVVFNPDFNHADLHAGGLRRDSVCIVKVRDERPDTSAQIGKARVGMFNKEVPYLVNGQVVEVVRAMLDTLIVARHDQSRFVPVSVSIDKLEVGEGTAGFGEEGFFVCNMRFSYPVAGDSVGHQAVFVNETAHSTVDVTNAIEPLIYKGMIACARDFVEGTLDKNHSLAMVSTDSVALFTAQDTLRATSPQQQRTSATAPMAVAKSDRIETSELSFQYAQGDKIKTGVRGAYTMLSQKKDSQFPWGLGLGLTYYDIVNTQDLIKGRFVSFGGSLTGKYYFSGAPTTAYLRADISLTAGSERINYGTREEVTFFVGPTVEEVLGLSIERAVNLEVGMFQLVHFGSKLLPNDVGFVAGIAIKL